MSTNSQFLGTKGNMDQETNCVTTYITHEHSFDPSNVYSNSFVSTMNPDVTPSQDFGKLSSTFGDFMSPFTKEIQSVNAPFQPQDDSYGSIAAKFVPAEASKTE